MSSYDDIVEWARRMTLTGICSEGMIYFAGKKVWASDTFHVFERFVSVGNQMPEAEKFIHDQLIRIQQTAKTSPPAIEEVEHKNARPTSGKKVDRELLHELMKRGISEKASLELLRNLRPDQQVMDQLEWGDHLLRNAPQGKFYNPAGILI